MDIIERASALVGCRYRPQGREASSGVDCVGLILLSFDLPVDAFSRTQRSGMQRSERLRNELVPYFRRVRPSEQRPGDVLVARTGPGQRHLILLTRQGFIHAEARLRAVVHTPGKPSWPIEAVYRRRSRPTRKV